MNTTSEPTPQLVADELAGCLPRATNIFRVELTVATEGCRARAVIGGTRRYEISGLGETLPEAIVELHNAAMRWEPA